MLYRKPKLVKEYKTTRGTVVDKGLHAILYPDYELYKKGDTAANTKLQQPADAMQLVTLGTDHNNHMFMVQRNAHLEKGTKLLTVKWAAKDTSGMPLTAGEYVTAFVWSLGECGRWALIPKTAIKPRCNRKKRRSLIR